jgi:uncharacterized cupredoxin-like copper-binding protein
MRSRADDRKRKTKQPDLSYCPDGMRRIAVVIGACLALAGCGGGGESSSSNGSGGSEQTVMISETEFALGPKSVDVAKTGTVTFEVKNDGQVTHALEVEGNGVEEETESIEPGQSATLTVDLGKAGTYEMYCPIDDHESMGMEGDITVGSSTGAGGGMTTDEGTTTDESPGY